MMATILAPRAGLKNPEEVFVAGLLHDLGQVIICEKLPDLAAQIERDFREQDRYRSEIEQEALELTHADVAGWVADMWNLPSLLKDPMMFHHRPTLALTAPLHAAIIHVADILVKAMGCGAAGNNLVPTLSPEAWKLVRLGEEGLAACIDKAAQEFETIDQYLV
jgi:HD-like signal output (HDOD) protein